MYVCLKIKEGGVWVSVDLDSRPTRKAFEEGLKGGEGGTFNGIDGVAKLYSRPEWCPS